MTNYIKTHLAISIAPADHGWRKSIEGFGAEGDSDVKESILLVVGTFARDGDKVGEEKDKRYKAMKKSSLSAQKVKRTLCDSTY